MQEQDKNSQAEQPLPADGAAAAEAASAAAPAADERLAAAEARAQEMEDAFLRARAEVENMRRRSQEEVARAHKFAVEGFAEALLPVRDALEMALKIDTPSVESLKAGVEMTLKQMTSAFEKHKLLEVNPQPGEKLDPMKHQALSLVAAPQEPNTVVEVLQKGYTIADRLLRPALVTVAQENSG